MVTGLVRAVVRRSPAPAAACIAGAIAAGAVATAAIPDSQGVIHACYSDSTGAIRLTDTQDDVPRPCQSGETKLDWNQRGPQGPAGPQGPTGPAGRPGPAGAGIGDGGKRIADLALGRTPPPQGFTGRPKKPSAALTGKLSSAPARASEAYATFKDGPVDLPLLSAPTVARLALPAGRWVISATANAITQIGDATLIDQLGAACRLQAGVDYDLATALQGSLGSQVVHRFAKPGYVELRCTGFHSQLAFIKITAIRISKLHNVPAS